MSKKPVPSKKQAVASTRSRSSKWKQKRAQYIKNLVALDTCHTTGEAKLRHYAGPSGFYKGRKVFEKNTNTANITEIEA